MHPSGCDAKTSASEHLTPPFIFGPVTGQPRSIHPIFYSHCVSASVHVALGIAFVSILRSHAPMCGPRTEKPGGTRIRAGPSKASVDAFSASMHLQGKRLRLARASVNKNLLYPAIATQNVGFARTDLGRISPAFYIKHGRVGSCRQPRQVFVCLLPRFSVELRRGRHNRIVIPSSFMHARNHDNTVQGPASCRLRAKARAPVRLTQGCKMVRNFDRHRW